MEARRRITLSDQMKATVDTTTTTTSTSSSSRNSLASLLNDVVQKSQNQTLLDIIQQDQTNNNNTTTTAKDRNSWKLFKDILRLKRRNSDESTHQHQQLEEEEEDIVTGNSDPTEFVAAAGESSEEETREVSMSLMDLLEETEVELDPGSEEEEGREGGVEVEEGGVEVEKGGVERNVTVEYNCCVCMVRHKGAAFIPCGHTFCRMCSRELWVSRGNCPLCNHFILEILDIF